MNATAVKCPTTTNYPHDEDEPVVLGCGSTNVMGPDDEGFYDCLNCGLFFDPSREVES